MKSTPPLLPVAAVLIGFFLLLTVPACWHSGTRSRLPTEPQLYPVRGVIRELNPAQRTVIIKHEAIPGYMAAMTMPFEVKDPKELEGFKPDDQVSFVLCVTEKDGWIEQLAKVGTSAPYEPKPREAVRVTRIVQELNAGDLMSDYGFTNELGRAVRLSQFQGDAYAITFFYTRCPFPTFCPRMSGNFAEAARLISTAKDAPRNWRLLSLTFDPDHDTPARLRAYALRYDYDPKRWSFLTGPLIDIDAITEQFGMVFDREGDTFSHTVRTVVVDPNRRIHKIFVGNTWKPDELAGALQEAARVPLKR